MAPAGRGNGSQRDPKGRFPPGISGNPEGINGYAKLRALLETAVAAHACELGDNPTQDRVRKLARDLWDGVPKEDVPGVRLLLEAMGALSHKVQVEHTQAPESPEYVPSEDDAEALLGQAQDDGLVH